VSSVKLRGNVSPYAAGECGGGQRTVTAGVPPLRHPRRTALLLAQLVHSSVNSVELLLQPLCFIPEHLNLLPLRWRLKWSPIGGTVRRCWGRSPPRPAWQPGGIVLVSPSPAATTARAVAAPASTADSTTTSAVEPTTRPCVCPAGCVVAATVTHAPACPRAHACRTRSISCWHSAHLPSIPYSTFPPNPPR
jgi:hypothetical protein